MTFSMPPVRNQYIISEIDVVFDIMSYRKLTKSEILMAVAYYQKTAKKWPPQGGTRITIPCALR